MASRFNVRVAEKRHAPDKGLVFEKDHLKESENFGVVIAYAFSTFLRTCFPPNFVPITLLNTNLTNLLLTYLRQS